MTSSITLKRGGGWKEEDREEEEEGRGGRKKKEKRKKTRGAEGDRMEKRREGRSKRYFLCQETTMGKSINL